jgi:signal peptidase I
MDIDPSPTTPADTNDPEAGDVRAADEPRGSSTRTFVEWVLVVAGALLVALVIKTFLVQAFYIPSSSMEPTLRIGDRVLVNKVSYHVHDVNRGDIVVFERPPNASVSEIHDLIKRVIGLPEETIVAHDGKVFIDGVALDEPYLPPNTHTPDFAEVTIPPGHVFVLGDNRTNSSASNVFGPIDEDLIVGRAFMRVWPLNHISGL